MTTHASATAGLQQTRIRPSLFNPATLLALAVAAAGSLGLWSATNHKQAVPDFHGEVGGLAFSPYHRGETPEANQYPSTTEIRDDLAQAARITSRIRTYTVAGPMADIPALAADYPLRVTLGAWLDRHTAADDTETDRVIETANANPDVDHVLVGNEVLLREDLTAPQLIAYIAKVRAAVHVPVSTAEPWHVWIKHPELAASVDYITIHLLPYWEGLPIDQSLAYIMDRLDQVQRAYPGKHVVIGEVGWPSNGVAIGGAQASRVNQALFMRKFFNIAQQRGLDYFVMEAFDQPWKTSFEGRAAGYWGMMDLDRHAKWAMTGSVQETPDWTTWALFSTAAAALAAGLLLSRRPDIRFPGKLLVAGMAQTFGAVFALVLLAMAGKYLSHFAEIIWGSLAAGQALLLFLLMADSFELAETVFGRVQRRHPNIVPAPAGAQLPKVSIHLPICNEPPHMVRQTLDALARLDYPDFEVLVIDNNTTDPALWEPVAEHCARLGGRFRFFHLGRWPGFKAGALNFALGQTTRDAEIIAVLDSDYLADPDWLRCMVPQFANPRVGFVQSPQDYHDNDGSFFKRLMFWEYAGFFQLGMVNRNERNAIIQHGTMSLVRRSALEEVRQLERMDHHRRRRTRPAPVPRRLGSRLLAAQLRPRRNAGRLRRLPQATLPLGLWRHADRPRPRRRPAKPIQPRTDSRPTLGVRHRLAALGRRRAGPRLSDNGPSLVDRPDRSADALRIPDHPVHGPLDRPVLLQTGADLRPLRRESPLRLAGPRRCRRRRPGPKPHHRQGRLERPVHPQRALPAHAEDGERAGADPGPGDGARRAGAAAAELDGDDRGRLGASPRHLGSDTLVRRAAHPVAALSGGGHGGCGRRVPSAARLGGEGAGHAVYGAARERLRKQGLLF